MTEQPIVVYHTAAMGEWREVVREQLLLLKRAGLTSVRLTHVGNGLDWILEEAKRYGIAVVVVRADGNTDHYETFALWEIERLCKVEKVTAPILYFHTKGVASPQDQAYLKVPWRRSMGYNVVTRWRENVRLLRDHDVVGQNWLDCDNPHFSGNFWMARPEWIARLPDFTSWHNQHDRVRFSCEFWIGAVGNPRVASLGSKNVWYNDLNYRSLYPSITWVSFATPNYTGDLARLVRSADRLDEDAVLEAAILPCRPFRMTKKFDVLRDCLAGCKSTHLFWIDADCEFVATLEPADILDPEKSLVGVRHFRLDDPVQVLQERLRHKVQNRDHACYWQACLFGGEKSAMGNLLEDLRWMEREGETYNEHGINVEFNKRKDQINTLPCRFAAPSNFGAFPEARRLYEERSGGEPIIMHHNRNWNKQ